MNAPLQQPDIAPLCVQNAQREERREPAKDGSDLRALIKSGHLTKRVEVRIIIPEGKHSVRHIILAKRGQYINRDGITRILKQECENCVKHLPQYDFRIVVFSPDRFNLIGEIKGLHPALPQDALHSASCAAEDGRRTLTPIDSPASAAFPTDETRSLLPLGGCDPTEGFVLDEAKQVADVELEALSKVKPQGVLSSDSGSGELTIHGIPLQEDKNATRFDVVTEMYRRHADSAL